MRLLWQQISSATITEILCGSQFDGVVLDLEHGCFNPESVYTSIQICSLARKVSFVRVTHLDKTLIRMALDAGVSGIIMSTVDDYERAQEFLSWCNYPTLGGVRGQGLVRENLWGTKNLVIGPPCLVAQIETEQAVNNIANLAALDFKYFMIGPYDLSASLGDVGNFTSKKYMDCVSMVENHVGSNRMGYHLVKDIETQLGNYKDCGFLAFGMDSLFLIDGVRKLEAGVI